MPIHRFHNPPTIAKPIGYTHVVEAATPGRVIYISGQLGLDVNGRYIFMQKDKNNVQVPTTFNPDYWTLALGLAIKF